MSLPDRLADRPATRRPGRTRLVLPAFAALALALGGCQVRPLYAVSEAPDGQAAGDVNAELTKIAVESEKDRVAQELMNQVIFALRGGASLSDPTYTLSLLVRTQKAELIIREREEVPTANLITITTTYTLTDNTARNVVTSGTLTTTASYDFSSQRFSNLRAERDAENRAARLAAADIRTRLAAVLATRQ